MDDLRQAVVRLCAQHGVLTDYHDVWGHHHEASTDALVKLLAELGVEASSTEAARAAEREARAAREREILPPLVAIDAGAAEWSVTVRLSEPRASLRWTLLEENGFEHQGEMRIDGDGRREDEDKAQEVQLRIACPLPMGYHRLRIVA